MRGLQAIEYVRAGRRAADVSNGSFVSFLPYTMMSAVPSIATVERTSPIGSFVP
jgi:hypothetical protein